MLPEIKLPEIKLPEVKLPDIKIDLPRLPDIEGDLRNPGRIWENVRRETENVGREIDRMRLEFNAVTNAPLLAAWLQQSRNNSMHGAMPIPVEIRQQLVNFYDEDIYNRVRFKIGDGGALNLSNLSIQYGDAQAVALIDVVVFANEAGARSASLWAHELKHIQQYRDWGVHDFAIRYIRSYNSVENDAYQAERNYIALQGNQTPFPNNGGQIPLPVPTASNMCATPFGQCFIGAFGALGTQCHCITPFGRIDVGVLQ